MLLEFLKGNTRTLTQKDFLDLIESYDETKVTMKRDITDVYFHYGVNILSDDKYFITSNNEFILYIDDDNKRIYVDKDNIFSFVFRMFFSNNKICSAVVLKKSIGEYEIIDKLNMFSLLSKEIHSILENYIEKSKDTLFSNISENRHYSRLDNLINYYLYDEVVTEKTLDYSSFIEMPENPKKEFLFVEQFCFNKKSFNDNIIEMLNSNLSDKHDSTLISIYANKIVQDKLKNDEIPNVIRLSKEINDALQFAGKTINVTYTKCNKEYEVKCENRLFGYNLRKTTSFEQINIESVTKITFGKKVLFEK